VRRDAPFLEPTHSQFQSTHPCGVRRLALGNSIRHLGFQSTHPCGVRHDDILSTDGTLGFQSTHPCGVRLDFWGRGGLRRCFNPRTPAGCGLITTISGGCIFLFQSTHPCGVRPGVKMPTTATIEFQSTHPCGVRLAIVKSCSMILSPFQSTHPCGVRLDFWGRGGLRRCFNPRTPAGCGGRANIHQPGRGGFNPRTPAGCGTMFSAFRRPCLSFNPRTPAGCGLS